ncbi:hypothetical protein [Niabella drilacis]|uniref:Lipoprotein n=1 Tax=Niabella drilacis (strain DSM 25811 / CCM 8410 / CCUG 62505 / LMG 26954 / E90) TaxID=1285928 RepID=A0A1G7BIS0_NIADE|nr:hypothetical protein [Niabella drilacis]SDE26620.1 hypothetical protein SAMN04487894_1306 [Niabella drilacis]
MKSIFPILVMLLLFLSACDPSSEFRKTVDNKSNYNLLIYEYHNPGSKTLVKSGEKKVIASGSYMGTNNVKSCVAVGDSVICEVEGKDGLKVSKDFNNDNDWSTSSSGNNSKGYRSECNMVISNNDIMPE